MVNTRVFVEKIDRSIVYRWFSGLFYQEISADILNNYRTDKGYRFLTSLSDHKELRALCERLIELSANREEQNKQILDLAGEFAFLFLGAGGRKSAHPYASAYLSSRGLLFQENTVEMLAIISELGLSVDANTSEPADHIAIQLNVLAELAERMLFYENAAQSNKVVSYKEKQIDFIEKHLLSWLPQFVSDCSNKGEACFYALAGNSLVSLLEQDLTKLRA